MTASTPGASTPVPQTIIEQLRSAVASGHQRRLDELTELVAIPSIAWEGLDPAHVENSAKAVADLLRTAGLEDVQLLNAPTEEGGQGRTAVVARRAAAPGMPTVLMYAHHDVQPIGDEALWDTPPFVATRVGDRLFGRGAADDKAGIMVHVGALRAISEVAAAEGLGLTYFIEGEEEAGSPSFRNFLEKYQELLRADVIIVADSGNWKIGVPALTTSLRGMTAGEFEVRVLDHAVHSGMYGGPILDAPTLAARLVATLHDAEGNVAVEGLLQREVSELEYPEDTLRADAGILDGVRLAGTGPVADRLWNKPAISLIGLDVTSVALSSNTIAPVCRGKVSVRVAPGQSAADAACAMEEHFAKQDLFGAQISYRTVEAGSSFSTDLNGTAAQAELWALSEAFGEHAVPMGIGGSIPFIADLKELFPEAQILITGVEDPDSRAHSANESLHIGDFDKAVLAEALLLARLAAEARA
ncbi:dipeptidase [Galactobacter valiniphilus]|uniref:Dipeptidase n=1 Tax=Galactobacter valiniphilus TaxID=2676122 RepID=A0A399JC89_9MICC|nr:M20/M25/M40 family metallo-hydrolase [Galactobacter valiniphilus]RII43171.1 dipeptidase [Galactobacter valiniphilus]